MRIVLLFLLVSCAQLPGGRSYFAEMTREDRGLWEPYRDFPVVTGDQMTWGYSEEVRRLRTPASAEEAEEYDLQRALEMELAELEAEQTGHARSAYAKHSEYLGSISEKIYYLKLPYHERYSYLESKGIIAPSRTSIFHSSQSLSLGMSKNDVISLLGRPQRVEIAGNPSFENERWLYAEQGGLKYVYFESGKVGGWE